MNLKQIRRDLKNHEVMACHDLEDELASVEFKAFARIDSDDREQAYSVVNGVATIDVRGFLVPETKADYRHWGLTGYKNLAQYIDQANSDYSVDSIVLDIDSGGGYVKGQHYLDNAIDGSQKPIEAFVSGSAYSAAYRIAASTDKITATPFSQVGSIGTLVKHVEHTGYLAQIGAKVTNIRSGKWKAVFGDDEPLTDEQEAYIQNAVDENAAQFFEFVANHRGMSAKTVESWQGHCFDAQKGKELGLIDAIADSVAVSTSKTQSNNNPQSNKGESMDLQEALAKIGDLQAQVTAATEQVKAATAEADKAKQMLAETQASSRQAEIDKLAVDTGREFSAEQVAEFKAMTASQFAVAAALATPQALKLPSGLDKEQATHGRNAANESKVLARIEELKKQGAK